jgi:hypothetical protein
MLPADCHPFNCWFLAIHSRVDQKSRGACGRFGERGLEPRRSFQAFACGNISGLIPVKRPFYIRVEFRYNMSLRLRGQKI